ncbi:cyclin-domain-containing protein [Lactifluus subvellereus]|nr:cyclin-domain-containing protein [Lactifluus subvellereus]
MESSRRVGLPPAYEDADIDALCQLIALMLDRLISINDRIPLSPESISRFHSASVPQISILDYLRRIVRFTNLEKTCLLLILHYIDQICAREPTFTISSLTVHRFIIAAVSLSSKSHCDAFCTNAHYARVGGLAPAELARLERAFLAAIEWRLACTREVLQLYYVNLVAHSGGRFFLPSSSADDNDNANPANDPAGTGTGTGGGGRSSGSPEGSLVDSPGGGVMMFGGDGATSSPAVVPAAGPPPPVGGPEGTSASLEQNIAFAQFRQRTQREE